jgi:hypothetical protein
MDCSDDKGMWREQYTVVEVLPILVIKILVKRIYECGRQLEDRAGVRGPAQRRLQRLRAPPIVLYSGAPGMRRAIGRSPGPRAGGLVDPAEERPVAEALLTVLRALVAGRDREVAAEAPPPTIVAGLAHGSTERLRPADECRVLLVEGWM